MLGTGDKENLLSELTVQTHTLSLRALTNKSAGYPAASVRREKRNKGKASDTSGLKSVLKVICWEGHLPGQGAHGGSWLQKWHSEVLRCVEGLATWPS